MLEIRVRLPLGMILTGKRNRKFLGCWECSVSAFRCALYERFMGLYSYNLHIFLYVYNASQYSLFKTILRREPQEAFTGIYNLVKIRRWVYFQKTVSSVLGYWILTGGRGDDGGKRANLSALSFCLGHIPLWFFREPVQAPSELDTLSSSLFSFSFKDIRGEQFVEKTGMKSGFFGPDPELAVKEGGSLGQLASGREWSQFFLPVERKPVYALTRAWPGSVRWEEAGDPWPFGYQVYKALCLYVGEEGRCAAQLGNLPASLSLNQRCPFIPYPVPSLLRDTHGVLGPTAPLAYEQMFCFPSSWWVTQFS